MAVMARMVFKIGSKGGIETWQWYGRIDEGVFFIASRQFRRNETALHSEIYEYSVLKITVVDRDRDGLGNSAF